MIPAVVARRPIVMNGVIASVRTVTAVVDRKYCSFHGRPGHIFYTQSHRIQLRQPPRSGSYHWTAAAATTTPPAWVAQSSTQFRRPTSASFFSSSLSSNSTTTTTSADTIPTVPPNDDQTSHPNNRPCWRFAIVGSGPSGCYTAKYLQHAFASLTHNKTTLLDNHKDDATATASTTSLHIDIFERLPTPYGLVRNGVAPDHPDVKNVQNDFDKQVFSSSSPPVTTTTTSSTTTPTTSTSVVQFYGNVEIGRDLSLNELRQRYDGVILAYGCESDRPLSLPGHDLHGVLCAREFVAWYNGHPDYGHVGDTVRMALQTSTSGVGNDGDGTEGKMDSKHIVVIGHGNVALDCARILAKPYNELVQTDLATRALDVLWDTTTRTKKTTNTTPRRDISVVGRRGHVQAAFTIKEVRELTKLPETSPFPIRFRIRPLELVAGKVSDASREELKSSKPKQRVDALLTEHANADANATDDNDDSLTDNICTIDLRFLLNPVRYEPNDDDDVDHDGTVGPRLGSVLCERTELVGDVGCQSAIGTGNFERLKADLCLVSIGYKGVPIAGTECYYDDVRGILTNVHGVVDGPVILSSSTEADETNTTTDHLSSISPPQEVLAPLYVSGWLKRGPSGIIGTNIADAKETVASIMKDVLDGRITMSSNVVTQDPTQSSIQDLLQERNAQVVDWHAYQRINEKETSDGYKRHPNQPREKITVRKELLKTALGAAATVEPQPKKRRHSKSRTK